MTTPTPRVSLREVAAPLAELAKPVDLHLFTGDACEACIRLERFAQELVAISQQKIHVDSGLSSNSSLGIEFQIDKHPAILVHGAGRYKFVYSGVPSGFELPSFVDVLREASTGEPQVQQATRARVEQLTHPVRIQVFVTPPCGFCPTMTRNTGKLAILSSQIAVEIIDAFEFPAVAEASGVHAVPYTKINDDEITLNEAVGEAQLVYAVLEASYSSSSKAAEG